MSETQDKWNDFYKDKQWIDTKGWCDLDGNPLPFEHDDFLIERKSSKRRKNTFCYNNKRMYADKVSFFKTFFNYCFWLIRFFLCYIFLGTIFSLTGSVDALNIASIVFKICGKGLALHFFYFIVRCIIDDNLRF